MLKDRLVGTWRLVSLETRHSDGTVTNRLGPHPIGRFMFDSEGNFAAQLSNPDRASDDHEGYVANFGSYDVDEVKQSFTLHFEGSVQSAGVGTSTVRYVNFVDGNAVFNTDSQAVEEGQVQHFITWEKIAGS